jgi:uncharacterized membrane protein YgaE (UPF0421/DUF939 family)
MIEMIGAVLARIRSLSFNTRSAFLCLPAVALTLGYTVLSGDVLFGAILTSGALSVGFGSVHVFTTWRSAPMLLAAIGMSVSAFVGSTVGNHEIAFLVTSALWAAACAMFTTIELGAWWIILQWSIALLVAGTFPADLAGATLRAVLILAGGLLQIACVNIGWWLVGGAPSQVAHYSLRRVRKSIRLALHGKLPTLRHAVRAALSVVIASGLAHWLALPNGYWAPMTALIVLRPKLRATRSRGLERLVGTAAGAGLASLVGLMAPPTPVHLLLALVGAWLSFGLQRSDYLFFTIALTATVVFFLGLDQLPEIVTAWHRLAATLLGGGIAIAVAFLTNPRSWRWLRPAPERVASQARDG